MKQYRLDVKLVYCELTVDESALEMSEYSASVKIDQIQKNSQKVTCFDGKLQFDEILTLEVDGTKPNLEIQILDQYQSAKGMANFDITNFISQLRIIKSIQRQIKLNNSKGTEVGMIKFTITCKDIKNISFSQSPAPPPPLPPPVPVNVPSPTPKQNQNSQDYNEQIDKNEIQKTDNKKRETINLKKQSEQSEPTSNFQPKSETKNSVFSSENNNSDQEYLIISQLQAIFKAEDEDTNNENNRYTDVNLDQQKGNKKSQQVTKRYQLNFKKFKLNEKEHFRYVTINFANQEKKSGYEIDLKKSNYDYLIDKVSSQKRVGWNGKFKFSFDQTSYSNQNVVFRFFQDDLDLEHETATIGECSINLKQVYDMAEGEVTEKLKICQPHTDKLVGFLWAKILFPNKQKTYMMNSDLAKKEAQIQSKMRIKNLSKRLTSPTVIDYDPYQQARSENLNSVSPNRYVYQFRQESQTMDIDLRQEGRQKKNKNMENEMKQTVFLTKSTIVNEQNQRIELPFIDFQNLHSQILHHPLPYEEQKFVIIPQIKYPIEVQKYTRDYSQSIYGYGMSNLHSAYSLRHSIPQFSFPSEQRFLYMGIKNAAKYPGPGSYLGLSFPESYQQQRTEFR